MNVLGFVESLTDAFGESRDVNGFLPEGPVSCVLETKGATNCNRLLTFVEMHSGGASRMAP